MRKLSDEPVIILLTKELHAQSNEIDQDMLATDLLPHPPHTSRAR